MPRKRFLIILPLLGGCLANFSTFDQWEFMTDYQSTMCDLYVDCSDGTADMTWDSSTEAEFLAECEDWTNTPNSMGCAIQEKNAEACYRELTALASTINATGECSPLWSDSNLPSCRATFLNCETDRTFGSVPEIELSPPTITQLTPRNGVKTGGSVATITGSFFDDSTAVKFNGRTATVISVSETELEVEVPAGTVNNDRQPVPVEVTNANGSAIEPELWTYWNDRTNYAGAIGGLGVSTKVGSYPSVLKNIDEGATFGAVLLTENTVPSVPDPAYPSIYTSNGLDSCVSDSTVSGIAYNLLPVDHSSMTLQQVSTGQEIELSQSAPGQLNPAEWKPMEPETRYSIYLKDSEQWPDISIEDSVYLPSIPNVTAPNIYGTSPPSVDPKGMNLRWSSTATSVDYLTVMLGDPDTAAVQVICFLQDDGEYTFHSSMASLLPEVATLFVCRSWEDVAEVSFNNGYSRIAGLNCAVGAVQFNLSD